VIRTTSEARQTCFIGFWLPCGICQLACAAEGGEPTVDRADFGCTLWFWIC